MFLSNNESFTAGSKNLAFLQEVVNTVLNFVFSQIEELCF